MPPKPEGAVQQARYSVVVSQVPVRDLLFALARDAKVNVDVHPAVQGTVSINALDQTLPQILKRLARQVDLRWEFDGRTLVVSPDTPFLKTYKVDYVNVARSATGSVSISSSIAATGGVAGGATSGGNGAQGPVAGPGNTSSTLLTNSADNAFWKTLAGNLRDLLQDEDKLVVVQRLDPSLRRATAAAAATEDTVAPGTGSAAATVSTDGSQTVARGREANHVIVHPESGVVSVRATARQHAKVQEFLDKVLASAQRQVMIEATVVEVLLSNTYQAGVDWSRVVGDGRGLGVSQTLLGTANLATAPVTAITYSNTDTKLFSGSFSATIKLLEHFGKTKVLSSPKLLAMNNQTALLKVVDEKVYFTVTLDETRNGKGELTERKFTGEIHTVPVGMVMSVTPQVSDGGMVTLNVRPSISRVTGYQDDPVPQLQGASFKNRIPEIQVRELESVLKVADGDTVVLGGLMQDSVDNGRDSVPVLGRLPLLGDLFSYRNETSAKSELVIFLRPVVVRHASLDGDLAALRSLQPGEDFLSRPEDAHFGERRLTPPGTQP